MKKRTSKGSGRTLGQTKKSVVFDLPRNEMELAAWYGGWSKDVIAADQLLLDIDGWRRLLTDPEIAKRMGLTKAGADKELRSARLFKHNLEDKVEGIGEQAGRKVSRVIRWILDAFRDRNGEKLIELGRLWNERLRQNVSILDWPAHSPVLHWMLVLERMNQGRKVTTLFTDAGVKAWKVKDPDMIELVNDFIRPRGTLVPRGHRLFEAQKKFIERVEHESDGRKPLGEMTVEEIQDFLKPHLGRIVDSSTILKHLKLLGYQRAKGRRKKSGLS